MTKIPLDAWLDGLAEDLDDIATLQPLNIKDLLRSRAEKIRERRGLARPEERAWMPVSQPPEASGWVLAWFQEQHSILLFDKQQGWYWGDGEHVMEKGYVKDITHWMPLPDGPLPQNRSSE